MPGNPDVVVAEAIHVGAERAVGVEVDVGNEELILHLEQEEGGISVCAEPLPVFFDEFDNLGLGEAQGVEVVRETTEDFAEVTVFDQLVDSDVHRLGGRCLNIETPVFEVVVEVAGEEFVCFGQGFLAVGCGDGDDRGAGEELCASRSNFHNSYPKRLFATETLEFSEPRWARFAGQFFYEIRQSPEPVGGEFPDAFDYVAEHAFCWKVHGQSFLFGVACEEQANFWHNALISVL